MKPKICITIVCAWARVRACEAAGRGDFTSTMATKFKD